jgi:hypothetical protein
VVQDLHLDGSVDESPEARSQRGHADLPVAGISDNDDVGTEQFPVGFQEGAEGR